MKRMIEEINELLNEQAVSTGDDTLDEAKKAKKADKDPRIGLEKEMDKYRKYNVDATDLYPLIVADMALRVIRFSEKLMKKPYKELNGGELQELIKKLSGKSGNVGEDWYSQEIEYINKQQIWGDVVKAIHRAS